jgi:hypothetical protein
MGPKKGGLKCNRRPLRDGEDLLLPWVDELLIIYHLKLITTTVTLIFIGIKQNGINMALISSKNNKVLDNAR